MIVEVFIGLNDVHDGISDPDCNCTERNIKLTRGMEKNEPVEVVICDDGEKCLYRFEIDFDDLKAAIYKLECLPEINSCKNI